jgi:hypothetical protein
LIFWLILGAAIFLEIIFFRNLLFYLKKDPKISHNLFTGTDVGADQVQEEHGGAVHDQQGGGHQLHTMKVSSAWTLPNYFRFK